MRYADVIVDGDPVISAFRMLFRHQRYVIFTATDPLANMPQRS